MRQEREIICKQQPMSGLFRSTTGLSVGAPGLKLGLPNPIDIFPECGELKFRSGFCSGQQRELTPFPMAVYFGETDFAQPIELRFEIEQFVRRIFFPDGN